jgi:MYXO-CTERM domain-containing protein
MVAPPPRLACAALAVVLAVPAVASAHIRMTYPPPRTLDQKTRPCGGIDSTRGTNVTFLDAGATIEVRWDETIDHTGHYRISFDLDGQDFGIPPTANGSTEGMPNVLKDLIADRAGTAPLAYTYTITLPSVACTNCTLQLIQLMTDHGAYTTDPSSDDIYFQCADIVLRAPGTGDAGVDAPTGDTDAADGADAGAGASEVIGGCGCRTSQGQGRGMALAAMVLGIGMTRRRRR